MQRLAGILFALAPWLAFAQTPASLETVAKRYHGAETYCERGKWGMRDSPAHGYTQIPFARCARRDGRFKLTEYPDTTHRMVSWTDGAKFYRYGEGAGVYQEYPADQPYFSFAYAARGELYPGFLSPLFPWRPAMPGGDEPLARLEAFQASGALSNTHHTVYERYVGAQRGTGERVWVLSKDQSIVRWEGLQGGEVIRFVEIASQEINPALADDDLSYAVPLFTRFSLQNNPKVFVAGLFIACALAGMLFWSWLLARAGDIERTRRRLWRFQLWTFGVGAVVLAALAILASIGRDTGHPPAILLVFVLAIWCAGLFGLTALFTLTSYPARWLLERRQAREAR
jgi:hypothetical protein